MLTGIIVVLAVLLAVLAVLFALLGLPALRRRRDDAAAATAGQEPARPALGSPAQVLLERGEKAGRRLQRLAAQQPLTAGAGDDVAGVVDELRAAAGEVAVLDQARAGLSEPVLQAEQQRLDAAIAMAAAGDDERDYLRAARASVAARLDAAGRQATARDALLARMRAAVNGLEQAETELAELQATLRAGATAQLPGTASAALADRLAGLRAGLAEVRGLGTLDADPGQAADQGPPGDVPGSVEPPPRT